jgi:hypothetical protein
MLHRIIMRVRAWVNGENVVIKLSKISWKAISLQGAPCHVYTFVIINLSVQYQTTMIYIMILNAPCAVTKYTFSGSKAICRYNVHLHNIHIYIYISYIYRWVIQKKLCLSHPLKLYTFGDLPGRVVRRPCGGPPRHRQRVHGHRQRVRQQRRGRGGDAGAGSGRGAAAAAVGPEAALKVTAPWTLPLYAIVGYNVI